jgi:hypothetical protein
MTQEVKNFSSGVLANGGLVQKEQEREAKRQQERLRKEAEEKSAAEAVARRIKAREERAIEKAEQEAQAKAKQLADEERRRKADEKSAQDEVARLQVVAAKEAARLERQKDLERRLAEKAALQQEEAKRKTQQKSAALLDSLSKEPEAEEGEPTQEQETEEESAEPVFAPVKGEVLIPAEMPSLTSNPEPEPIAARDISELLPPPVVLTVEAESQAPIQVESGTDLIERVLSSTEEAPKEQIEETAQPNRSENRFQKMANTNRDLVKENDALKSKVEDLLDKLHSYEIEGELVGSMMDSVDRNKKEKWHEKPGQSYLNKDHFSIVKEAKQEMLKYLSTRQGEIDHGYKSELFAKYMDDPFYMNVFVQNHDVFEWWPVIDSIYNSRGLPKPDWSKVKVTSNAPQPIRARTATLGSPVASSEQPMDRIAQHLGNMGI